MLALAAPSLVALALVALGLASAGCTVGSLVTRQLADRLAAAGTVYASDDDPELVRAAVPFALKTMEQVSEAQPRHAGLLAGMARSFTEYAYTFVQQDADRLEDHDIEGARKLRTRALRLFLRAREYGLRGLELRHPGLGQALRRPASAAQAQALVAAKREDVPLLFWTATAWALAASNARNDMRLVGELPIVEALMARSLALDEAYDEGAIHEFYVGYLAGRSEQDGGGVPAARRHLERARVLSHGKSLGVVVTFAESADVASQNRTEFRRLLEEVLAVDVDLDRPHRLANLIAQQRARWLLGREAELFAD